MDKNRFSSLLWIYHGYGVLDCFYIDKKSLRIAIQEVNNVCSGRERKYFKPDTVFGLLSTSDSVRTT